MSLVVEGAIDLTTPVRSILGDDLPLIDRAVNIEHLLAHRSGIGDYLDEEALEHVDDHVMPLPVHLFDRTEAYIHALDGHAQKFEPGERFSYCNSGYVVLALVAERVGDASFADLVSARVIGPAGMTSTGFLRSDELPGDAANGYLRNDGLRTNVLHLPVLGSGDGGVYSTTEDISLFWTALFSGAIVPFHVVRRMTLTATERADGDRDYGLGFWVDPKRSGVMLEGFDAGVSFRSWHQPSTGFGYTVISNTSSGAWRMARMLSDVVDG
jgi:CubicO group peptidase (beta-lactamase class C family)